MERNEKKKRVSADIPFSFLNEMGHNTRAMERFFDLPRETQETLTDAVSIADDPNERSEDVYKRQVYLSTPIIADFPKKGT